MKHKLLGWVLIAFLVFYISTNPARAASTASGLGGWLAGTASAFGDFFTALFGGGR